jgi:hypothetical protein
LIAFTVKGGLAGYHQPGCVAARMGVKIGLAALGDHLNGSAENISPE